MKTRLLYRPRPEIDDWGMIRDGVDGNIIALVRTHNQLDEHALNEHRRNKTDPCEEVGRQIVEACNNYESVCVERDRLKAALEEFASSDNWLRGSRFDPNSGDFDGIQVAEEALQGDGR